MKIVTNGKYYRILLDDDTFAESFHASPDGMGYTNIFQTRFYNRAKRRFLCIFKAKVAAQKEKIWDEVPHI